MKKGVLLLFVLTILFIINTNILSACSCAVPGTPTETLEASPAVFSGKVININTYTDNLNGIQKNEVTFDVLKLWKGPSDSVLIVHTMKSGALCGFNFQEDTEYLVYASGEEDSLNVGICKRTKLLSDAQEDIDELNGDLIITCTDSDGGKDYFTKGKLSDYTYPYKADGIFSGGEDACGGVGSLYWNKPEGTLIEWYCGTDNKPKSIDNSCEKGCKDGACLREVEDTCTKYTYCPDGRKVKKCQPSGDICSCYGSLYDACKTETETEEEMACQETYTCNDGTIVDYCRKSTFPSGVTGCSCPLNPKNKCPNERSPGEYPSYIKDVPEEECKTEIFTCPGQEGYINGLCHWTSYGSKNEIGEIEVTSESCVCTNATQEEMCEDRKMFQVTDKQKSELHERERLEIINTLSEGCPEECSCSGAVIKCPFEDTGRIMTIYAGKSGKVIVQVRNDEGKLEIFVYDIGGATYGYLKEDIQKEINFLPEDAFRIAKEKVEGNLEESNIQLEEDGFYNVEIKKKAKLFWIFSVKEKIRTYVDIETGEISKSKNSWWGFLARDVN